MGTNYYLCEDVCEHCGRSSRAIHIGKSSGGWCFGLRVYIDEWEEEADKITSLEQWEQRWSAPKTAIRDEYGNEVSPEKMLSIITERSRSDPIWDPSRVFHAYKSFQDLLDKNEAEVGPNNLLRHRIGDLCSAHGEGTWDLMRREFS